MVHVLCCTELEGIYEMERWIGSRGGDGRSESSDSKTLQKKFGRGGGGGERERGGRKQEVRRK